MIKISTITPCYNHQTEVIQAINSAVGQKWSNHEIIVIDDGSDPPLKLNNFPSHVKLITHKENRGLSQALNTGIEASTGDYYSILSADDRYMPNYLIELGRAAEKYPDADVLSCDIMTPYSILPCKPGSLELLKKSNCHGYSALVKRWLFEATGGYNVHMNPSWEDWEFWLHAAKLGATWRHTHKPLHYYNRAVAGRDVEAQGKDTLLKGIMTGFHQDVYGKGAGEVAFIIPCYEQEEFVLKAVESVFAQTYPHVRAIVVDDESPGDVSKALAKCTDSRLTIVRQPNKHLSGARNTGILTAYSDYKSQYVVPLDADDEVDPLFIERLMPFCDDTTYVYSDVQFIGEAWHTYEVDTYNCAKLTHKHLHACTILMKLSMWGSLVNRRGYGYDESMKEGYEDWEFALALLQAGYCGNRVPEYLFKYRQHKSGSMRQDAATKNEHLVQQIQQRHPWVKNKEAVLMACSSCGKSKYNQVLVAGQQGGMIMQFNIPGIGTVDGREPVEVTYRGSQENTITKIAPGGTIYKYSGNPQGTFKPVFTIFARDIHLFVGAYTFKRPDSDAILAEMVEAAKIAKPVVTQLTSPAPPQVSAHADVTISAVQRLEAKVAKPVLEYEPDDLTQIAGIGKVGAEKLAGHGIKYFEELTDIGIDELIQVLGVKEAKAKTIKASVDQILDELED